MEKLFLNKNTKTFLKSQLNPETRLAQSLLFHGEENLGKFYISKLFAKSILCENHTWMGCNNCKSCKAFDNGWHFDFKAWDNGNNIIRVEQLDELKEFLSYKPQISKNRILIINNADKLGPEAESSLLKLLEEPSSHSIIILVTSYPKKLKETILSRLLPIRFTKEPEENLKNFLKDNFKIKENDLDFYLALGENKIGKIVHLIEDPEYLKEKIENIKFLINIIDNDFVSASSIISKIATKTGKKIEDEDEDDINEEKEKIEKENKGLNQMVKDWLGFLHQILIHNDLSLWEKHLKVNLSFLTENPNLLRKLLRNALQLQNYTANYNLNKKLMLETFYLTVK